MSGSEIIKLRKQITLLNEYNSELKSQIEEQTLKIGELQNKLNIISMKYQKILNQNDLGKNKDNIQKLIETSLAEQKEINNNLKKNNKLLSEKISLYEQMINDKDIYINKLVTENSNLKRDLVNSSKNNGENNYSYIQKMQQEKEIINNDRNKLTEDYNKLRDQMEDIIRENRILRQMADVPENFGIDLNKVRLGEKVKIEDYKTKIRLLNHQIDELETERAQIKHNIYFLASSLQLDEPPFSLLSKEQKVDLAMYAKKLYEQKTTNKEIINECPKCKELNKILNEKDNYIKKLEEESNAKKEYKHYRLNSTDAHSFKNNKKYEEINNNRYEENYNNGINNEQMNELRNILRQSKDEIEKAINNKKSMNNTGNVYNLFQYNNNFFLSQNNINTFNNSKKENKIFNRGNKNNK
jgi:phage FluMu protein Com